MIVSNVTNWTLINPYFGNSYWNCKIKLQGGPIDKKGGGGLPPKKTIRWVWTPLDQPMNDVLILDNYKILYFIRILTNSSYKLSWICSGGGTLTSLTAFAPYWRHISDNIGFPGTKVHRLPHIRLSDYMAHQLAYTLVKTKLPHFMLWAVRVFMQIIVTATIS